MELKNGKNSIYIGNSEEDYEATIQFRKIKDGVVEVYHTGVGEKLKGQGIAGKLVDALVERAKEENFKVIPTCSFADKKMNENCEYKEFIYKE
ncbi:MULTISPECIES: GNAT family N-acetyltransferase [Peptoniphilus]|uniref:GNAT family N-acetyltransferase n=1 Tax=Peptoniphilus TaxID=162289 RepID=UPI0001DA9A9F|nr:MULTISPECIES: GNAT family N-acetyltransferase [Peptoniphilus]EFI41977.1 acetyltransferase, GNAT family [Peptoniphilus sp. oral taxon 386 str. F0131]